MIKFEVEWRTRASEDEFSIFSPNIHTVHAILVSGLLIHTFNAERLGIIAKLLEYRATLCYAQNRMRSAILGNHLKLPNISE